MIKNKEHFKYICSNSHLNLSTSDKAPTKCCCQTCDSNEFRKIGVQTIVTKER